MKNTKAIFLIIVGSFIMATGFAFASDPYNGDAYNTLKSGPFGKSALGDLTVVGAPSSTKPPVSPDWTLTTPAKPTTPTPPAVVISSEPAKPKPTLGEKAGEFFGKYRRDIFRTGISAYLGLALIGGPIGLLIGAVAGFAFFYMAGMSNVGKK
ncbi:MAG TPA: hypothetical protein DEQ38_12910 [Elusimicrobia bacterium]|nr:MAG: hypothetical protein A2089_12255 [Elusimicrobia bacterium GWD2_63_28]HCC48997.1 hypothetical protein [Elusimicrobiota bacterium]